jgi:hypothetical protein
LLWVSSTESTSQPAWRSWASMMRRVSASSSSSDSAAWLAWATMAVAWAGGAAAPRPGARRAAGEGGVVLVGLLEQRGQDRALLGVLRGALLGGQALFGRGGGRRAGRLGLGLLGRQLVAQALQLGGQGALSALGSGGGTNGPGSNALSLKMR